MAKSHKKEFFVLFLIVATELIGFGLIIPMLPQITARLDVSKTMIGILMASYSFAQFIAAPLLGQLSDKYGRKPILVISKAGTVLAYALLAFAGNYTLFLIARLIDGFTGGNISTARAYVADITSDKDRPKGMAIIGISFGVGFVLGPAIGGILYGIGHSHMVPALFSGAMSLLALILTIVLLKEPEKRSETRAPARMLMSVKTTFTNKVIAGILGMQFIYFILFSGFETTFALFTFDRFNYNEQQNSMLFFYIGILALLFQGFLARKAFKNIPRVTVIGLFTVAAGYVILSQIFHVNHLYLALIVLCIGISLVNTYLPSLLTIKSAGNHKGQIMGLYEGVGSLSRIIGPLVAYLPVFGQFGAVYLTFGTILSASAAIFCIILFKKTNNVPAPSPAE